MSNAAISERLSFFLSRIYERRFDEETLKILESLVSIDAEFLLDNSMDLQDIVRSEALSILKENKGRTTDQELFVIKFLIRAFDLIGDAESCYGLKYKALVLREHTGNHYSQLSYEEWLTFAEDSLDNGFYVFANKGYERALSCIQSRHKVDTKISSNYTESQVIEMINQQRDIALNLVASHPVQGTAVSLPDNDDRSNDCCENISKLKNDPITKLCPNANVEMCRYYVSSRGCARGSRCYFSHGEGDQRQFRTDTKELKHGSYKFGSKHPSHAHYLDRKVFIGGLPTSISSDYLKDFFQAEFGLVEEAVVVGAQKGKHVQSRGFGFVIFKEEESVTKALSFHFITISGKRVEIKRALPENALSAELPITPLKQQQTQWSELNEDGKESRADSQVIKPDIQIDGVDSKQNLPPPWLIKFRHWLPGFLKQVSARLGEGEWYPLSSLKGDFRATCEMELDHTSIGYFKLSDFLRTLHGVCRMRLVPIGMSAATHMVLLPPCSRPRSHPLPTPPPRQQQKQQAFVSANESSSLTQHIIDSSPASPPLQPIQLKQTSPISQSGRDNYSFLESLLSEEGYSEEGSMDLKKTDGDKPSPSKRFLQFLMPSDIDLFLGKHPLQKKNGGNSSISRGDLCLYCKPQSATVLISPCGHKVLCESCRVNKLPLKCLYCDGPVEGLYHVGLSQGQMAIVPVVNAVEDKENYWIQGESTPSTSRHGAISNFRRTWTSLTPAIEPATPCTLTKSLHTTGSSSSVCGYSVGRGKDEGSSNYSCNKRDTLSVNFLR